MMNEFLGPPCIFVRGQGSLLIGEGIAKVDCESSHTAGRRSQVQKTKVPMLCHHLKTKIRVLLEMASMLAHE